MIRPNIVLFSAGIDSTVVATMLARAGSSTRLCFIDQGFNAHRWAAVLIARKLDLELDLVQRFSYIYFSKDNVKNLQKGLFGKSVASANHSQLRQMLKYKSLAGGTSYIEVDSKFSTRTCSSCGALAGPAGLPGLKVRRWECSGCGTTLDRDINSAINTLNVGAGRALERMAA